MLNRTRQEFLTHPRLFVKVLFDESNMYGRGWIEFVENFLFIRGCLSKYYLMMLTCMEDVESNLLKIFDLS